MEYREENRRRAEGRLSCLPFGILAPFPAKSHEGPWYALQFSSKVLWFLIFPRTDPALVWSEFLGVISGSEGSLAAENGYMDRESYEKLSHRTQATFARQRGPVYSLFQAYIRHKRELEGYDVADRFV